MKITYQSADTIDNVYTISAYDYDALIGFGQMQIHEDNHRAVATVKVSPAYEPREIESTIMKLLLAECKYCHIDQIEFREMEEVL